MTKIFLSDFIVMKVNDQSYVGLIFILLIYF